MKHRLLIVISLTTVVLTAAASAAAMAPMMHPRLAARLSGMGEHGTVNLQIVQRSRLICWRFGLPMVSHITRTSIHTGLRGPMLLELGMRYMRSGCEKESAMTLAHLEAKPGSYYVWVDTKGHPGDLRGRLYAGTASMKM